MVDWSPVSVEELRNVEGNRYEGERGEATEEEDEAGECGGGGGTECLCRVDGEAAMQSHTSRQVCVKVEG